MDEFWNSSEYINLLHPFIDVFETSLSLSCVNKQAQYSYVHTYDYCKDQPVVTSNNIFENPFRCMICKTNVNPNMKHLYFKNDYPPKKRSIYHCLKPECSIRSIVSWGKECTQDSRFYINGNNLLTLNTIDISFNEIELYDENGNDTKGIIINGVINKLTLFLDIETSEIYIRVAMLGDDKKYLSHNWIVHLKEVMRLNHRDYIIEKIKNKQHSFYSKLWCKKLSKIWGNAFDKL